jgi:non-SMC mitotic condensation complex subunit 1
MTLTFLVLAGQVKVKGQLGEMAKCLEDEDRRIADLAKMFFTELSTKDNAIYNSFTDIFSILSSDKKLEEDSLKRIVKFLMSFIEKVLAWFTWFLIFVGKTRETTCRKVGFTSSSLRNGKTMERRCIRSVSPSSQK